MLDMGLDVADSEEPFSYELAVGALLLGEVAHVDGEDVLGCDQ